jgi:putative ATP-dependent endonuclease of the OLD family
MKLRKLAIQNVRSFLERQDLILDGEISILIGPNGGGKTNLLDTAVVILRRFLFASMWPSHAPTADNANRYEFRHNDALNAMVLDRHSGAAKATPQLVEVELEVTERDLENMRSMKATATQLAELAAPKYVNAPLQNPANWDLGQLRSGQRVNYRLENGNLSHEHSPSTSCFLQYLQLFEIDSYLREEFELSSLSTPMVYLPVNRTANGFQSSVQLASYNEYEQKRQSDAAFSRTGSSIVGLAVGRLAQKFRLLLEKDKGNAAKEFYEDKNLKELTTLLADLGYEWSLECQNPLKNEYDVRLKKQGSSFLVGAASSGEREILTYLFAIFALNVRDALIIVDEPELHLHPKWQRTLLRMFSKLAATTGNQFLLATHSPTFIAPESIQFVSRVFSHNQKSRVIRLNSAALPTDRHLFNIVNSHNNERLFFADKVVLVEGLSDRIFFEALLKKCRAELSRSTLEIIAVGGKGFFDAYVRILDASQIEHAVIADLDYVEQLGTPEIKSLFSLDAKEIKKDVIENVKSRDGDALVAQINEALVKGTWADAQATWEYIKSNRRQLKSQMTADEQKLLVEFIEGKRQKGVFILKRGSLESYLPEGHRSKDLEKLIRFVNEDSFVERLEAQARRELMDIVDAISPAPSKVPGAVVLGQPSASS